MCVLVEHQSQPQPDMPFRIISYAVAHWREEWLVWYDQSPRGPLILTPVLPIFYHTGTSRWRSWRSLSNLYVVPEVWKRFLPKGDALFFDLAEKDAEELLTSVEPFLRTMAVI